MNIVKYFIFIIIISALFINASSADTFPNLDAKSLYNVINGRQAVTDLDALSELYSNFSANLDTVMVDLEKQKHHYSHVKKQCDLYTALTKQVQKELIKTINIAVGLLNKKNDDYYYSQARIEILAGISYQMVQLALADAEGGLVFGSVKNVCVSGPETRPVWKKNLIKKENSLNKLIISLFGTRKFTDIFKLSNFLAEKELEKAEYDANVFIASSVASLVVPQLLLSKFGYTILTGLGLNISLKSYQFVSSGALILAGAGVGGSLGSEISGNYYEKLNPEIMRGIENQYKQINQFIKSDFDDPSIYLDQINEMEKEYEKVYNAILEKYGSQYRKAIELCEEEQSDDLKMLNTLSVYCQRNWPSYYSPN